LKYDINKILTICEGFGLPYSLCSYRKPNPSQKMAAPLFALPTRRPVHESKTIILKKMMALLL